MKDRKIPNKHICRDITARQYMEELGLDKGINEK